MNLRLPVPELCRVLDAEALTGRDACIDLPIESGQWLGGGDGHPLRIGSSPGETTAPRVRILPERPAESRPFDRIPLLYCRHALSTLRFRLGHHLDRRLPLTIAGTLVAVDGSGVLLTGPAGVGKSECALGLLDRGHTLVCDDAVVLEPGGTGSIDGVRPSSDGGFLLVRGLGPIAVHRHYPQQEAPSHRIDLMARLSSRRESEHDPLRGAWRDAGLMGRPVPAVTLPPGGTLPLLVEVAARECRLKASGYDTVRHLADWQRKVLE